jgi:hypothetical protein
MVRASLLNVDVYEEVEADSHQNWSAFAVVVVASVASALGTAIGGVMTHASGLWFLWGLLIGLGTSIVGWLLWALTTYVLGTTIFKGPETEATYGQLLRTLGFSNSPGVLRFFSFIPFVGGVIAFAATVWVLVAGVVAVRQALDFSTWRAIGTCVVGWIIYLVVLVLIPGWVIGSDVLF